MQVSHLILDEALFAACFNGWSLDFNSNESCPGGAGGGWGLLKIATSRTVNIHMSACLP